jgi:hypothetical protein
MIFAGLLAFGSAGMFFAHALDAYLSSSGESAASHEQA